MLSTLSRSTLPDVAPRLEPPGKKATIAGFHKYVHETYCRQGQLLNICKEKSNSWVYTCPGCTFHIIGDLKKTGGDQNFYVRQVQSEHVDCQYRNCGIAYGMQKESETTTTAVTTSIKAKALSGEKRSRTNWSEPSNQEKLEEAIEKIKAGASQQDVAIETGISQAVLSKTLTGKRAMDSKIGRNLAIPVDMEEILKSYCLMLSETGWGIGRPELKSIATQIMDCYPDIKANSNNFKASNSWAQGFMARHPQLASRRGQSFELRRASGLNPKAVAKYFTILEKAIEECTRLSGGKINPDLIVNLDESAMALKNAGRKIIARMGSRRVHVLGFDKLCSSRMTSVNMISAGKKIYDPFYILEGTHEKYVANEQKNVDGSLKCFDKCNKWTVADKGYMTYKVWEDNVVPDICAQFNAVRVEQNCPDQWALLVLDGFGAHSYSIKALKMFIANKIKVIRMPSHTSSALQPLDVTVFKTVKLNYERTVRAYLQQKSMETGRSASLSKYEMGSIFHGAWKQTMETNRLGEAGFKCTGMYPLNMNWVKENMDKMSFSQAFSTDSNNRELAEVAIENNVLGYQEAKDIWVAKQIRLAIVQKPIVVSELLAQICNVSMDDFSNMVNRVSTSQYSGQATDGLLVQCWWKAILDKFRVFMADNDQPAGPAPENPARKKRKTTTSWGESVAAGMDLTDLERLESMARDEVTKEQEKLDKEQRKLDREASKALRAAQGGGRPITPYRNYHNGKNNLHDIIINHTTNYNITFYSATALCEGCEPGLECIGHYKDYQHAMEKFVKRRPSSLET
jgi:hypothetical protein